MHTIYALTLMVFFAVGCTGKLSEVREEPTVPVPAIKSAEATKLLQDNKYPESIAAFQRIIQEYPNSAWEANALFSVATAFVSVQNPNKDYAQALTYFDEFLSQYPQHERALDAKNWRQALKVIIDSKKENDRLLMNIEKLKQLDMRQEQKRLGR